MNYKVEVGNLSEKVKKEISAITMKAGTLEVAYAWWEGLANWVPITKTNAWPINTTITTAWTVRNVGNEAASFKVVFAGGGMDVESEPVQLNPGEDASLYADIIGYTSGTYECSLTIYADNEVVEKDYLSVTIVSADKATLHGLVHDSEGNPLDAVTVFLNERITYTISDGTFDFTNIPVGPEFGPWTIFCEKDGYQDFSKDITLSVGDNEVDITMLAEEEEEEEVGIWEWIKDHWGWIAGGVGAAAAIGGGIALAKKRK